MFRPAPASGGDDSAYSARGARGSGHRRDPCWQVEVHRSRVQSTEPRKSTPSGLAGRTWFGHGADATPASVSGRRHGVQPHLSPRRGHGCVQHEVGCRAHQWPYRRESVKRPQNGWQRTREANKGVCPDVVRKVSWNGFVGWSKATENPGFGARWREGWQGGAVLRCPRFSRSYLPAGASANEFGAVPPPEWLCWLRRGRVGGYYFFCRVAASCDRRRWRLKIDISRASKTRQSASSAFSCGACVSPEGSRRAAAFRALSKSRTPTTSGGCATGNAAGADRRHKGTRRAGGRRRSSRFRPRAANEHYG